MVVRTIMVIRIIIMGIVVLIIRITNTIISTRATTITARIITIPTTMTSHGTSRVGVGVDGDLAQDFPGTWVGRP